MKRFLYLCVVILLFTIFVSPVSAESGTGDAAQQRVTSVDRKITQMEERTMKMQEQTQMKQDNQSDKIVNLKDRADREIDRRIASLTKLIDRVNGIKRLSATQKSTFTAEIQTQITNLTALKTKIAGDTDLATLRTDVQSIVQSYRIYALFMPQLSILVAADTIGTTADKFSIVAGKLQTRIQEAQTAGHDVSALQSDLTDMQQKISDAQSQIQNAITGVVNLTPDGYPGNKTALQSARGMLETGRKDLNMAMQDIEKIIRGLREMNMMKHPSGMMSPMPSISPTL